MGVFLCLKMILNYYNAFISSYHSDLIINDFFIKKFSRKCVTLLFYKANDNAQKNTKQKSRFCS